MVRGAMAINGESWNGLFHVLIALGLVLFAATDVFGQERLRPQTLDDLFAAVAEIVPAFAGMYRGEAGTLHVNLTDTGPTTAQAAEKAIRTVFGPKAIPEGGLRLNKVRFGFLDLKAFHDQAASLLGISGVVLIDIDERRNRLRIGLNPIDVQAKIEMQLTRLGIPRDAVNFEAFGPFYSRITLQDEVRPLIGGLEIGGGTCTLGFIAVRSGVRGFVTNSHCTTIPGGVESTGFRQPAGGFPVGVEIVDPIFMMGGICPSGRVCRFSDSTFVAINSAVTSNRAAVAHPSYPGTDWNLTIFAGSFPGSYKIVSAEGFPLDGDELVKVGRTTGQTKGEVIATCATANDSKSNRTFFCQFLVDGAGNADGDSGSPVLRRISQPYDVGLVGILWGGNETQFVFSPLLNIQFELGPLMVLDGDDPPTVKIVKPSDSSTIPYGAFNVVSFEATILDPDNVICFDSLPEKCPITWHSLQDGYMGAGKTIQFNFTSPGTRNITVTATDSAGNSSQDSITVNTGNTAPSVWIKKPTNGTFLYKDHPYVFEGASFDSESFQQLPCTSMKWISSNVADVLGGVFPKTGCNIQVSFGATGQRTVALLGKDSEGMAAAPKMVTVNVVNVPVTGPPNVTILSPNGDAALDWNLPVTLKGVAKDPDGQSPINYRWLLKSAPNDILLGTAAGDSGKETSMQWIPSSQFPLGCGSKPVTLRLEATDANGQISTANAAVSVIFGPC
jgi:hypothetical protein